MDYMFKDVKELTSVEMKSDKNCQIESMISTFENCEHLESFSRCRHLGVVLATVR